MTSAKCQSISLGREGEVDGGMGGKKERIKKDNFGKSLDSRGNLGTKYAARLECMKNI